MSPQVQAYGSTKVEQSPLPGARLTNAPNGDALAAPGEVVSRVASGIANGIAEKSRNDTDQVAVLNASNRIDQWQAETLTDPTNGALNQHLGKDAAGLPDAVGSQFDTLTGEIAAGLNNDTQRMAFARMKANRWFEINKTVQEHVARELTTYDQQETGNFLKNRISDAVSQAGDPRAVSNNLGQGVAAITDHARRMGAGPEAIDASVRDFRTDVHTGVISQLLTNDQDKAAQVYYEETKDQISGEARTKIEAALAEGSIRGESQRQADVILHTHPTYDQAETAIEAIDDPKLRDAVEQRVKTGMSLAKSALREQAEQTMTDAGNLIDASPGKGVRAIPASTWSTLSPGQKSQLELYAKRNLPGNDPEGKTDPKVWYDLYTMGSNEATRDKFAQVNLTNYLGHLSKSDFKQLAELQGAVRKGDARKVGTITATEGETTAIVNSSLLGIGVNPNPPAPGASKYDAEATRRVLDFRMAARKAVSVEEAQKQRKLTTDELQGVVDTLMTRTQQSEHHWFSANVPEKFAFEQPQKFVTSAVDVPTSERQQIETALKSAGLPITDAAVLSLFNRKLALLRGQPYTVPGAAK